MSEMAAYSLCSALIFTMVPYIDTDSVCGAVDLGCVTLYLRDLSDQYTHIPDFSQDDKCL